MADTQLDLTALKSSVRTEIGEPTASEINDSTILDKIKDAVQSVLRAIGAASEETALGSIQCVANQQAYDIPTDRQVSEVFWGPDFGEPDSLGYIRANEFAGIPETFDFGPGSYWRSDQLISELKARQIASAFFSEILNGKIYVYPTPTSDSQSIYYTYRLLTRSADSMSIKYRRAVLYGAAADCLRVLANKRRGTLVGVTSEGLARSEKANEAAQMAEMYDQKFQAEILSINGA